MSDPQPPAWNPENNQNPYSAPLPQHGAPTPQPQYGGQPPQQPEYGAPPQQPEYGAQPQQPEYGAPPQQSEYGAPPPQPPQYGSPPPQPQYGAPLQPPQYYGQPQQPYYGQPHQPPQHPHHQEPAKRRVAWLLGIAVVLALIVGAGVLLATRGGDEAAAGDPMPTATYSDGLTTGSPSPTQIPSPTAPPSYTPKRTPTFAPPTERRRTLRDIDEGIKVYDDVYVKAAPGWRKEHQTKYTVSLLAPGRGAAYVWVSPVAYRAETAAPQAANAVITIDHLIAAKKGPVETVTVANSNIDSQAQISLTGRIHTTSGASISMVARCTVMTGVESIHNVTVILCVEGRQDDPNAAFRDMPRMLASIARSI